MRVRLGLTLFWSKPPCFSSVNDAVLKLMRRKLHKQWGVYQNKAKPASLSFKGQATKHTAVECSISVSQLWLFTVLIGTAITACRVKSTLHILVHNASFALYFLSYGPCCYRGFARQPYWMAGQWKLFALERTFVPMGKRMYCSCHPTWLPCKTSIGWCKVTFNKLIIDTWSLVLTNMCFPLCLFN